MQKWQRIDPTTVHNVSYRTLVDKTFRLPNGKQVVWTTINAEKSEGVAVIALTPNNKVIIARQFRPGPELIMDELPGGDIDPGEDKITAAKRELLEETGYEAKTLTYIGTPHTNAYENDQRHCMLATGCVPAAARPTQTEEEFIEVRLVTIDDVISIAKSGMMTDSAVVFMAYNSLMKLKARENT